jgi:ATP synthase in type III secretion protein N
MNLSDLAIPVGRIASIVPPIVLIKGLIAGVGTCVRFLSQSDPPLLGEVVGLTEDGLQILPYGEIVGLSHNTRVELYSNEFSLDLSDAVPGSVVDGYGARLGDKDLATRRPFRNAAKIPPLTLADRKDISEQLFTGVRAVDMCMPLAKGQRIVIQAPAGVGKTSLLKMILEGAKAQRCVLALVGERTREAVELLNELQSRDEFKRTTVVLATSDRPSIERAKAPETAANIALAAARQGQNVLLMIDSMTRYCRALREIALALGEVPTRRGYPSSVFTALPKILEKAGNFTFGSITLVCTVLVEDDLTPDPIAEEVQSLVDGHVWLSRELASSGHYPAIDVLRSISRLATAVSEKESLKVANEMRACLAAHRDNHLLLRMGEYSWGNDLETDRRLKAQPKLMKLLSQQGVQHTNIAKVRAGFSREME